MTGSIVRAFHVVLALISLVAWASLGVQVHVLIGSRGLLPAAEFFAAARAEDWFSFWQAPTFFWWLAGDRAITVGVFLGLVANLVALFGLWPRACALVSALLYLSFTVACRTFLSFQWDNMLIECGVIAAFLPRTGSSRWAHAAFRFLLFRLYFESGIAKWQSHLGDWQDGSAMTFYYETAPLPTWVAWYAHQLPLWWHAFESYAALALELVVPMFVFLGRRFRLTAFVLWSAFQIVNIATANYGFFCYLTLALHLFLLDESDLAWIRWPTRAESTPRRWPRWLGPGVFSVYALLCTYEGVVQFFNPLILWEHDHSYRAWRVFNTYHLFGHITRQRVEPELQASVDGVWVPLDLHHKAGDVSRRPTFVAPHQPRVDFRLWFFGLSPKATPDYVRAIERKLCHAPADVQPLFSTPLPAEPTSVRLEFWDYRFSQRDRRAWWQRRSLGFSESIPCTP